jgi:hypothetical protein
MYDEIPPGGSEYQHGVGILTALVIAAYAVFCMAANWAILPGKYGMYLTLHGRGVILHGVALLGLAGFLHFHFFWGNLERYQWVSLIGKYISFMAFVIGVVLLLGRILIFGKA